MSRLNLADSFAVQRGTEYQIRLASVADAEAMLGIYAPYVLNTAVSFEWEPPDLDEFKRRMDTTSTFYPWYIATYRGETCGYAYATPFRSRAAYQWAVETSVYLDPRYHRRGIARTLYTVLCETLRLQGYRTALACIALPNPTSVAFHKAFGFVEVGHFRRTGFKLGDWHDSGWFQFDLIDSDTNEKPDPPRPVARAIADPRWKSIIGEGLRMIPDV